MVSYIQSYDIKANVQILYGRIIKQRMQMGGLKMRLRRLEEKDCPLMLEWMHDINVVRNLKNNFSDKKLEDCIIFVKNSMTDSDKHFAIVDINDEYMGTVSLKNINSNSKSAEFAITIRRSAMGKGYSSYAMKKIIDKAFYEYGLKVVYWYVHKNNIRAIRFYQKMGYTQVSMEDIKKLGIVTERTDANAMNWYYVCKSKLEE